MSDLLSNKSAAILRNNKLFNSTVQLAYLNLYQRLKTLEVRPEQPQHNYDLSDRNEIIKATVKVAFICDEITWLDFCDECESMFLYPMYWQEQLDEFGPDLLFCESAWSGNAPWIDCWRGRIYQNGGVLFENRKVLLDILDYCKQKAIPTVFWNKEDPTFFGNLRYNFVNTALKFDYLFTTARECIPKYQAMGHHHVSVLPFGVNRHLFTPRTHQPTDDRVIFAGSWFGDQSGRCKDMCRLFDFVLDKGLALDIYDRKSGSKADRFRYPQRYRPYIRKMIPYQEMANLFQRYKYAININSVTDSSTMYSRRLLQLLACGLDVFSNRSIGMETTKGVQVCGYYADGNIVHLRANDSMIKELHSTSCRFAELLNAVPVKQTRTQMV